MKKFTGSIQYSAPNIRRLSTVLYRCFSSKQRRNILLCSAGLMIGGVVAGGTSTVSVLCIVFGCILLSNINYPASSVAKRTIKALNGNYPLMNYIFYSDYFSGNSGKEKKQIKYNELIKIVDDGKFLYLCPNTGSAYMVDKRTIAPYDIGAFKELISKSSSLHWARPGQAGFSKIIAFLKKNTK
ncbi:MAG: YcxB family protein [Pyramidobacter sp.]|nr:YcxB family protein [Pyramidobacter sp.]